MNSAGFIFFFFLLTSFSAASGNANRSFTDDVTSIIGTESVDINVGENTHVKGAVVANVKDGVDQGNLHLSTGTLTYEDLYDSDKSQQKSVSASYNKGGTDAQGKTTGAIPGVASGSYSSSNTQGVTHATVGNGTIEIRDAENQTQDVADLNRDVGNVQEITKDEEKTYSIAVPIATPEQIKNGAAEIGTSLSKIKAWAASKGFGVEVQDDQTVKLIIPEGTEVDGEAALAAIEKDLGEVQLTPEMEAELRAAYGLSADDPLYVYATADGQLVVQAGEGDAATVSSGVQLVAAGGAAGAGAAIAEGGAVAAAACAAALPACIAAGVVVIGGITYFVVKDDVKEWIAEAKEPEGGSAAATGGGGLEPDQEPEDFDSTIIIDNKIQKQMPRRGWSETDINNTVKEPYTTRSATNRANGNDATAYFNKDGSYIVKDNKTNQIIQVSNKNDPGWIPDATIKNPYIP